MKKFSTLFTAFVLFLLSSAPVYATDVVVNLCPGGTFNILCTKANTEPGKIIQTVVVILLMAAVVIALIFLIWGGIKWVLSGGDKSAVESARNHIVAAIVGLIIAFAAFFILVIVGQLFGVKILEDFRLPTFF